MENIHICRVRVSAVDLFIKVIMCPVYFFLFPPLFLKSGLQMATISGDAATKFYS